MAEAALQQRPEHEVLVEEFMVLDKECQELIEKFTTGKILYECIPANAPTIGDLLGVMSSRFVAFQDHLKQTIEKRNAKLQEASIALRSTVMAGENVVRGVDGKATTNRYGPFEVSSRTSRFFNPELLFLEVQKLGLFQRLLELKTVDKETGAQLPAVAQEWNIHYEPVKNWLREQNLEQVLQTAYDEEEGTPAVTGPKEIGWLGTPKTKK